MFPAAAFPDAVFPEGAFPSFAYVLEPLVFEAELETYLIAALGVSAWPGMIPQGKAPPALVYTLVTTDNEVDLDGADGLRRWSIQFDAWGRTRLEVATILARLRLALEGYRGPMGRAWAGNATLETDGHGFQPPANASDRPTQRKTADCQIWFRDSFTT